MVDAKRLVSPVDPPGALGDFGSTRRTLIRCAVVAGASTMLPAARAQGSDASAARPQAGDEFVFADPAHEGQRVTLVEIPFGGPQVQAWPVDPISRVVRNGSRLNRVLLVRLDPESLDEETRPHAAEGIVAYSAVCTHQQCFVTAWNQEQQVLHCPCHQSDYDPVHNAKVVAGPAPRALPALPLKIVNKALTVAGPFLGRIGTLRS